MPKKPVRNGFYWYMQELMPELRREGRVFENGMQDVVPLAHPRWKALTPKERERFDNKAKMEKAKNRGQGPGGNDKRMDNIGNIIAHRKDPLTEYSKARQKERKLVRSCWNRDPLALLEEKFYIIDFEYLCKTEECEYLPCEIGVVEWSMEDGVTKTLHRFVEPGPIPPGYRFECKQMSEDRHQIPESGFEFSDNNYRGLWIQLENFINPGGELSEYPPLYCAKNSYSHVEYCLDWLFAHACMGSANRLRKLYELDMLFVDIFAHNQDSISISMATDSLATTVFDYEKNVTCKWHEERECKFCALGTVKKFAFAMSDALASSYGFELTPAHIPEKDDQPLFTVVQPGGNMPSFAGRGRGRGEYRSNTPEKRKPHHESSFASRDVRVYGSGATGGFGQNQVNTSGSKSFGQKQNWDPKDIGIDCEEEFPAVVRQPKAPSMAAQVSTWGQTTSQNASSGQQAPPSANFQEDDFPTLGGAPQSQNDWPSLSGGKPSQSPEKFAGRAGPPHPSEAPKPPKAWHNPGYLGATSSRTNSQSSQQTHQPSSGASGDASAEEVQKQLNEMFAGAGIGRGRGILAYNQPDGGSPRKPPGISTEQFQDAREGMSRMNLK